MEDMYGKWGLYQWFEEHGVEMIHPDDVDEIRHIIPNGKVFECVGNQDNYLTIRYRDRCFRVRPSLFKTVPRPAKVFGEVVRLKKGGELISGTVCDIMWHFKKGEPFYFVAVDDKPLKKQYWLSDFIER